MRRTCRRYKYLERCCEYCKKSFHPYLGRREQRFCGKGCYSTNKAMQFVEKLCPRCGSAFKVRASIANRITVCGWKCRLKAPMLSCKRCGKIFRGEVGNKGDRPRSYCSEECRRPPIYEDCKQCGKRFLRQPKQHSVFCGFSCYRKFKGETSIEVKMRECLERLQIPFQAQAPVGRYSVDFAIPTQQIAIEVDGTYWHDAIKDARRDEILAKYGWRTIRFSEVEINGEVPLDLLVMDRLQLPKALHFDA
jgi:very-short-patch-repair endonuclease